MPDEPTGIWLYSGSEPVSDSDPIIHGARWKRERDEWMARAAKWEQTANEERRRADTAERQLADVLSVVPPTEEKTAP